MGRALRTVVTRADFRSGAGTKDEQLIFEMLLIFAEMSLIFVFVPTVAGSSPVGVVPVLGRHLRPHTSRLIARDRVASARCSPLTSTNIVMRLSDALMRGRVCGAGVTRAASRRNTYAWR